MLTSKRISRQILFATAALTAVAALAFAFVQTRGRTDVARLSEQARANFLASRFLEAEQDFRGLSRRRPLELRERLMVAECLRRRGALDDAAEAVGTPPDAGASGSLARLLLGQIDLERNRARDAERNLLKSLELDRSQIIPRRLLLELYTLEGRRDEVDRASAELEARTSLTYDELAGWTLGRRLDESAAEAVARLEAILAADPDDLNARVALANRLRTQGKLAAAELTLAPIPPDHPRAAVVRAALAFDRGLLADAALALRPVHDNEPDAARLRGRIALAHRQPATARDAFACALKVRPDDIEALVGSIQALAMLRDVAATRTATAALSRCESLQALVTGGRIPSRRDDAAMLVEIARKVEELGRPQIARGWYKLALKQAAGDAEIQRALFRLDQIVPRSPR